MTDLIIKKIKNEKKIKKVPRSFDESWSTYKLIKHQTFLKTPLQTYRLDLSIIYFTLTSPYFEHNLIII